MPDHKECPLCGETMRLKATESLVHVPGDPVPKKQLEREWVCPECDYFEEVEEKPA
jgi:rubredoxin